MVGQKRSWPEEASADESLLTNIPAFKARRNGGLYLSETIKAPTPVCTNGNSSLCAEVSRILHAEPADFRVILGLNPMASLDISAIESQYRRLMLLLHPDKRNHLNEIDAGGRHSCDEAFRLVQDAVHAAKREWQRVKMPDPVHESQKRMLRMQEIQRQQSRNAQQRYQQQSEQALVASLHIDIERAMSSKASCQTAPQPQSASATDKEILKLLGQLAPM